MPTMQELMDKMNGLVGSINTLKAEGKRFFRSEPFAATNLNPFLSQLTDFVGELFLAVSFLVEQTSDNHAPEPQTAGFSYIFLGRLMQFCATKGERRDLAEGIYQTIAPQILRLPILTVTDIQQTLEQATHHPNELIVKEAQLLLAIFDSEVAGKDLEDLVEQFDQLLMDSLTAERAVPSDGVIASVLPDSSEQPPAPPAPPAPSAPPSPLTTLVQPEPSKQEQPPVDRNID